MYTFAEKVDLILNVLTIKMNEAETLNNEKVCRNSDVMACVWPQFWRWYHGCFVYDKCGWLSVRQVYLKKHSQTKKRPDGNFLETTLQNQY